MTDDWAARRLEARLAKIRTPASRKSPLPPAERVDMREDIVHVERGPARAARAVRFGGSTMNQLTRQIIVEARKYLHVRETGGPNRGPEIDRWLTRVGSVPGQPWCAAFASCMLADACRAVGVPMPIRPTASAHRLIERGQQAGGKADAPGPGYLFGVDHGTGPQGQKRGHVGIVVEVDGDRMVTIEGNTDERGGREGQGVYQRTRLVSEATLGFVDPGLLVTR